MKMTVKLFSRPFAHRIHEKINVTLSLDTKYKDEAEYFETLEAGEYYELTINKKSGKKTLSQNGYAWELIQNIAESMRKSSMEVYKERVRESSNYVVTRVKIEDLWDYSKTWSSNGSGWFSDEIVRDGDWVELRSYYGMSAWNKEQTSKFIDDLVQDAKALGIPTIIN